ncbi:hypothetical protein PENTCL1PPCAC_13466, partial [Pristionchus entomophagus]
HTLEPGMRWLAIVALATAASALPEMFLGRRTRGLSREAKIPSELLVAGNYGKATVSQKLDHFDVANEKTWDQRYFFNHEYKKPDSNVNVLYLDGEQWDSESVIINDLKHAYVYYAEQLGADLYTLEHRFYGRSHPTTDSSVENLKYLSSRQAVEDIAEFIRQINKQKGSEQRWIVIGGSYAGALAAWIRLMHPELVAGSVASSGPVLAQMDFYGYLQTVDEDFKNQGGLCYQQMKQGFKKAQDLLQSEEGRATLSDMFKITPPFSAYDEVTPYDIDTFFSYLTYPFEASAQYNDPPPATLCEDFTVNGAAYDPLLAFTTIVDDNMNANFTQSVEELAGVEFKGDISMRLWFYQTCTEFGYFQ